jgi:hypothetical protein
VSPAVVLWRKNPADRWTRPQGPSSAAFSLRLAEPRSISLPLIAIGGCCHEDRPSGRWPAIYCCWAFLVRTRDGIAPMAAQFSDGRLRRRRRSRRYRPCLVRMAVSARAHLGSRRRGFCCPSPSLLSKIAILRVNGDRTCRTELQCRKGFRLHRAGRQRQGRVRPSLRYVRTGALVGSSRRQTQVDPMADIQIDAARAERIIAQILRDEEDCCLKMQTLWQQIFAAGFQARWPRQPTNLRKAIE